MSTAVRLAEKGLVPDFLLRRAIRSRLSATLAELGRGGPAARRERERALIAAMRSSPIAIATDAANLQHYEVPAAFFDLVLGARKKYSCCLWPEGTGSLDAAEEAMLDLTASRAGVADGMEILELGCGWGSFCLWAAGRFPASRITALSNSRLQRAYIEERAVERGLRNLRVLTANAADFDTGERFDRVISIEMFEHMRNVEALLARIARWLRPDGRLFVHVFSHREHAYTFDDSPSNWMASEFFTGGMMPSDTLYLEFQRDLLLLDRWVIGGTHYARTLRAWLERLDAQRESLRAILAGACAPGDAPRQLQRWRMFFIACEESFAYSRGEQWRVSHYLFGPRP